MKIFGKEIGKKEEPEENFGKGFVPTDRVRELSDSGMSDKDIIEQLKNEGFSYQEIEKAMIQSLKSGPGASAGPPEPEEATLPPTDTAEPAKIPSSFTQPHEKTAKSSPVAGEAPEMPPLPSAGEPARPPPAQKPSGVSLPPEEEQIYPPEFAVEELVEGVVQEKWNKFEDKFQKLALQHANLRESIADMVNEIKSLRNHQDNLEKEFVEKLSELEDRIEDAEAKAGAIERTFKQFFPKIFEKAMTTKKMKRLEPEEEQETVREAI
ncbi:MAG: hypothetical protein ACTSPB_04615 [Candidatus Thorarchaeota archaeon]